MSAYADEILAAKDFWTAYILLAREGHCDTAGGMESQRVYGEWVRAGQPADVITFIAQAANVLPTRALTAACDYTGLIAEAHQRMKEQPAPTAQEWAETYEDIEQWEEE